MRLLLIAAISLLATGASAAEEGELDINPEWLKKPDFSEVQAVWPTEALREGRGGKVVLVCEITAQGLLEACIVESETPPGEGFGAAALLLTPSFVLKPGVKDGRPVRSSVRIPVSFGSGAGGGNTGSRLLSGSVQMVTQPVWAEAPSFADLLAAWPARAEADFGHVSMRCRVNGEGGLGGCRVLTETPKGEGFGRAARDRLAPKFRMRMAPESAEEVDGAYINLPIRFISPADPTPFTIVKPKWITQLNPEKVFEVYPPAAIEAGVASGRGVADCLVAADGGLTDCKPAPADPEGLGFSESAVAVASVMRMNPWSDGGGPVDGVRIRLPITFQLTPEEAKALAKP